MHQVFWKIVFPGLEILGVERAVYFILKSQAFSHEFVASCIYLVPCEFIFHLTLSISLGYKITVSIKTDKLYDLTGQL